MPQYNLNIVESGIKHRKLNPLCVYREIYHRLKGNIMMRRNKHVP